MVNGKSAEKPMTLIHATDKSTFNHKVLAKNVKANSPLFEGCLGYL